MFKIHFNPNHALNEALVPVQYGRLTRGAASAYENQLGRLRARTKKFSRCFVPSTIRSWNALPGDVFNRMSLQYFKEAVNRHLVDLSS